MPYDVQWTQLPSGLELPYVESGDPAGTPLVLVHGYAETWRSFEALLPELPPRVRAFAFTQRGHGGPGTVSQSCSLAELAADAGSFMTAVGLDSAIVVGCSSGGYVAQQLAVDLPELVDGLVLVGSPRSLRGLPVIRDFTRLLATQADPLPEAFVRDFVASTLERAIPSAFLESMIDEARAIPLAVWRMTLAALTEAPVPTAGASIAAPTLVISGGCDRFVPLEEAAALAAAIPGSTLIVYEHAGHAVHWENPGRVAADVTTFLGGLHPPDSGRVVAPGS